MVVAVGVMAAIGKIDKFDSPDKLVAYIGLPERSSAGDSPAYHGRTTKRGSLDARHPLGRGGVADRPSPGPYAHLRTRPRQRGNHIAAVTVARKLAVLIWHLLTKGEDYSWVLSGPARQESPGPRIASRTSAAPRSKRSKRGILQLQHLATPK